MSADGFAALSDGRVVVVIDQSAPSGPVNLMAAAEGVSVGAMSFIVRHGSGLVTVALPAARCAKLQIPVMVATEDSWRQAEVLVGVAVDATEGTSTGISAFDRAITARLLGDPAAQPGDFRRPGHVMVERVPASVPTLLANDQVVHPAAVGLAACDLAGLGPAIVRCELVADTGELSGIAEALEFAAHHDLRVITFGDVRARARELVAA